MVTIKNWREITLLEYVNSKKRRFFLPDMGTNGLELVGYTTYEVYTHPKKQLELAKKMDEIFESDFTYSLCDGNIFCEVLGLELLKADYDFPSVIEHPIKTIEDVRTLEVPNPYKTGRMPLNLETYRLIARNIDKPFYVSIQGPFTLAIQMAGATHLLKSIITDKEYVKALLDFTKETVKLYSRAANDMGAKYISIAEPGTITLSPADFEEYIVPMIKEIHDNLDSWKGMHICGDTSELLELMIKCSIEGMSLDQIMDYKLVAPKIPKNIVLIGNLDPIDVLGKGTIPEIRRATLELKKDMEPYDNYLFAFGCNCLNDTPVENLQEAMNTARK